jgi:hypothetical protein
VQNKSNPFSKFTSVATYAAQMKTLSNFEGLFVGR